MRVVTAHAGYPRSGSRVSSAKGHTMTADARKAGIRNALLAVGVAGVVLTGCSSPSPVDKQIKSSRSAVLPVIKRINNELYGAHLVWLASIDAGASLCGDDDPLVPLVNARMLAERIPRATLTVVERAGHRMMWEEPERVAPRIGEFVGWG